MSECTINFVGDISLFKKYETLNIDPLKEVKIPISDYNIANFEFMISNDRKKNFFDVQDNYAIDYEYFSSLKLEKFQAYSLANNHVMDYGADGIKDAIDIFNMKSLRHFGLGKDDFNPLYIDKDNIIRKRP